MRLARALVLLTLTAAAQDRPETVIRTTTRLVEVRVMAEDSQGNPVTNLRQEELLLLDNRKPQPIASWVFEGAPPSATTNATADAAPNQPAREEYALLLIDWRNPHYVERVRILDFAKSLLEKFQPRQELAIYIYARKSYLLHDFTTDHDALAQALVSIKDIPYEPDDGPVDKFDARYTGRRTPGAMSIEEQILEFNSKTFDSFDVMARIADGMAKLPGRKSLIWVSNGFPVVLNSHAVPGAKDLDISYGQDMEKSIARLNSADVAVYPVDPCGLAVASCYHDLGTLKEFAESTGGTAFYDRNDLDEGMRLALEDSKISYTLGFQVPANAAAGLHQIQLTTTRKGVTLRYRMSYQLDDAAAAPRGK